MKLLHSKSKITLIIIYTVTFKKGCEQCTTIILLNYYTIYDVFSVFEFPTTANTSLIENLKPFTEYEFYLVASNRFGETISSPAYIVTKQDSK